MTILCTIDLLTREVFLPADQRIAAYDHNVDVIHFQAEPIEDFGLNTSSIRVAAKGPNKARHDYAIDPSTVQIEEETGYITFDWPIPAGVTEMPEDMFGYGSTGQLIFAVCAEIISGSTLSKAWHSDDGIITVVAHLEPEAGGGEDPSEEATNAQKIAQLQTDVAVINTQVGALANGSPTPVETIAEMTDESAVYLYTGSETGYTAGNWYFWNGTAWTSGGTYGGAVTDTTLSISGRPADAKAVGQALADKADADDVDAIDDRVTGVESDVSDLKADLGDYSFDTPVSYKDFVKGYHLQSYHVGSIIAIKADATNQRAITTTPIYFPRKTFLAAPNEYEFFLCVVTSKTDFTVLVENPTYYTHDWVQAKTYIMLQVRRKDKVALTDVDMGIINSWIDFQYKTFGSDDLKRLCALKKQFYSGNGSNYSNTHNLFLIAHITDIHADVQRYANFRKFVDDNASVIDCALCTGDYVDNQNDEQWTAMNEVGGNVDVLQVVGNHDAGNQGGDTLIGDADLVTKFGIETNTGKMYYYVDYDAIRIIVLNQFEGSTKGTYVYNNDEITWLLSVLDDSITNSKHVIIACHIPDTFPVGNNKGFYQRYNRGYPQYPTMNSGLEDVINAFKHGASVTTTLSGNINVNHTFSSAGDFVCWICGHYHGDFIGYSTTYSDQLYLNGNCGVCQPAPFKYTFMGETFSDLARIPKTASEDCFNAYAFDFKERLVKVVKIGANMNDILQPRQVAVYGMDGEQGNQ